MHKRHTHEDVEATRAARNAGRFVSWHSYASTRVHPGTNHPCIYLAGVDCGTMREEALARAGGRCERCGMWTIRLEVHHIEHKTKVSRCSCQENLEVLCQNCHRGRNGKHPQVQWTQRKQEAHRQFDEMMGGNDERNNTDRVA